MRYIAGSIALFFISVTPAFANVTNLSTDPVWTGQFVFYCQPYGSSFEPGKHYLTQNGPCVYSIPSTLTGTKQLLLMKGVPGVGAVVVGGDTIGFATTLVAQTPNSFSGAVTDDTFFAAVYETALDQGATPFIHYLSGATTTIPAAAVEGQNYYLLPWVWGPKPASEFTPTIIVPDILTTWQTDQGQVIDPLFHTYQNLIDTFVANGYVEGQTLFTFPYDWEQSNVTNATALANEIQTVKTACACSKVDLVAHGMGGLIATQYLESTGIMSDVDNVAFLGVPHFGVPASYLAWGGGQISLGSTLQSGLAQALLKQKATNNGYVGIYQYLQGTPVPSFLELLPNANYLDGKSYPTGYPVNSFIENLQNNLLFNSFGGRFFLNGARLIGAAGGSQPTAGSFAVTASTEPPLWPDGQPTLTHTTTGDGMVPSDNIYFLDYSYPVAHNAIPSSAAADLFTTLNNRAPTTVVNNSYPVSCILFVSTSPTTDMLLTDPNNLKLGKNLSGIGILNEIPNSLYSGYNQPTEYIAVTNPADGTYTIQTEGTASGTFTINTADVCSNGTVATSTVSATTPGQLISYQLTVDSVAQTLDIQQLDTQPPIITIFSPQNGAAYLTTDTVPVTVSITDPGSSSIPLGVYLLNGAPINPLNPLDLSTLPLGTSTLSVSATDSAGNTGYAESVFTVDTPPLTGPTITITNPIEGQAYTKKDVVYFQSITVDTVPIVATTTLFNGNPFDPNQPIPLFMAPIGTSTITVTVTDEGGLSATASVSFLVTRGGGDQCLDDAEGWWNRGWVWTSDDFYHVLLDCSDLENFHRDRHDLENAHNRDFTWYQKNKEVDDGVKGRHKDIKGRVHGDWENN